MVLRTVATALLLFWGPLQALAQLGGTGNLSVRVTFADEHPAQRNLLVQLMSGASNNPIASTYTNESGIAHFAGITPGMYTLLVTGDGIEPTTSSMFEVDPRKITQTEYVTVRPVAPADAVNRSAEATVNAAQLAVPENARKEFERGNDAMAHENWAEALQHLKKAVDTYPAYASAYNNLGIVYGWLNDRKEQRAALEKAISLDAHIAPAYVNLGELSIRQGQYAEAQKLLERAVALDPASAKAYTLLADAQLLNQQYQAALASAHKAHALRHDHLALTHYIAAKAYEHENQPQQAVAELQLFLKEEPQGPRADHMRDEIRRLQASR